MSCPNSGDKDQHQTTSPLTVKSVNLSDLSALMVAAKQGNLIWIPVCVCVCVRERERKRDRQTDRQTGTKERRQQAYVGTGITKIGTDMLTKSHNSLCFECE